MKVKRTLEVVRLLEDFTSELETWDEIEEVYESFRDYCEQNLKIVRRAKVDVNAYHNVRPELEKDNYTPLMFKEEPAQPPTDLSEESVLPVDLSTVNEQLKKHKNAIKAQIETLKAKEEAIPTTNFE